MIVADTNVISELMRAEPDEAVVAWIERRTEPVVTTAISIAEIRFGIERLPRGARRTRLAAVANSVVAELGDQILAFDGSAAAHYARLAVRRERAGRPIAALDAQIAAICVAVSAPLATRNVRDFDGLGIEVIDPWQPE